MSNLLFRALARLNTALVKVGLGPISHHWLILARYSQYPTRGKINLISYLCFWPIWLYLGLRTAEKRNPSILLTY
ncbi:LOW QUALITY PROTEIN: hypothetical protein SPRG_14205 [Saprolegnia parasitica CBS 223.65]|uniref:Uncharacterized protein n=1 Tax=Saprolegnia parasitica (strain CBS 223.65) TaxID=695850 RepID=A0A067BZR1_SAPPC|nr:LOW QUALITY PROTEIN: hypothetical protein SPRG_14205 [Saprolegnia parasitica CBS 223.65]KDO20057.1 LOW QUALITY PROTEIN: hypothetical protein SPRG_14205 [Saprolegnia parasitica CBS 223.65]|eukprot:XP_012209218.1 LOW QUALITY PROTEIN: hypothetical protein SPRG_14205 [Saprolegnia parasitica CBS 223.65]